MQASYSKWRRLYNIIKINFIFILLNYYFLYQIVKIYETPYIETTDLLRPKNEDPIASFSQIPAIFNIQKGTPCSHYSRGIGSVGLKSLLRKCK